VPGTPLDSDELHQLAVAPDEEMRGDLEPRDLAEVGMRRRVEPVGEQALDGIAAELAGRQADRVDHEQRDLGAGGAVVLVRRTNPTIRFCCLL